ncbi:transcriptional regulator, GntR family [Rhodoferax sp. OV413]|uniref:GntR family transcriptional regulator n=1 Tax=Rhodoferax sp. OV413 TaxID=1855285 RepID=UPI00088FC7FE|nr:GntR family transcriptional regulator [Rhodoferax sp. OV413]SDP40497.1 transcriptional regulator, GntR family [Rhodoferax sp. OV413]
MARTRLILPELAAAPAPAARGAGRGLIGLEAYESLRTAILNCSFTPGMALSELAVSEELGVSRAPVRDAFRRLVGDGLLEAIPQRGTFVTRLSRAKIADAIFVREVIECRAAELAAQAPLAARQKLTELLARQIDASDQHNFLGHLLADEDLHYQILVLAGHPHAWNPLMLARTGMNRIRHIAIPELGGNRIAIDQHRDVVQAIIDGDSAAASAQMLRHIRSPLQFVDAIHQRHPEYFVAD